MAADNIKKVDALTSKPVATAHVARTVGGDIYLITSYDSHAHMLASEGYMLDVNTPVPRLLEEGLLNEKIEKVMDDATWKLIAPECFGYQKLSSDDPLFRINPPDMPLSIARQRLDIVIQFMGDEDIQAYIELNEIIMAGQRSRVCNTALFAPCSKNASFERIYDNDFSAIDQWYRDAKELSQVAQGDQGSTSSAKVIDSILLKQQIEELSFVLDEMEAMQPAMMPSAG